MRTETLNTEKQEIAYQGEKQTNENWNMLHKNTTKRTLAQDDKNVDYMKKIMTEKKTRLPSHRKQYWKKNKGTNWNNKQIINKYPKGQNQWIKRADLCKKKISQW